MTFLDHRQMIAETSWPISAPAATDTCQVVLRTAPFDLYARPPRRRSPVFGALSLAAHGVVVAGLVWLSVQALVTPTAPQRMNPQRLTFITFDVPTPLVQELHRPAASEPSALAVLLPSATRAPASRLADPVPAPVEISRPEPAAAERPSTPPLALRPTSSEPFRIQPAAAAPTSVARPEVQVGLYERPTAAVAARPDSPPRVADAGFDGVGDGGSPAAARPATTGVGAAGFDGRNAGASPPGVVMAEVTATAGFDSEPLIESGEIARQTLVRVSGFEAQGPRAGSRRAAVAATVANTPVDVRFKPAPVYTAEARTARVEGDVVLELEFSASGAVHVLRVVRGLGHGLDEEARRVAEGIRFSPATVGAHPVDVRAQVIVRFRLAYSEERG